MATTNGGPSGVQAAPPAAQAPEQGPQLNVVAQYIKDFSFENPNAPALVRPRIKSSSRAKSTSRSTSTLSRSPRTGRNRGRAEA